MASTVPPAAVTLLDELPWEHRFTDTLPADPHPVNRRRQVLGAAFTDVPPTAVAAPRTLAWSPEVAQLLGLAPEVCASDDFAAVMGGNRVPDGARPHATCYGGHQFGNWAGQLGDGRAIALGEVRDAAGGHQVLQLKGAGPTPYSRTADGRAVLRSSLREYLCSEAMHHLGVPTTRALSLVATGDAVVRDVLYSGHPAPEPGAVVCRVAPSFTRFGHLELPAARNDVGLLEQLLTFTIRTHAPAVWEAHPTLGERVEAWFAELCERTAELVVHWMRVGFVHGVLNTDNCSVLGLTIDYGPYGWLEGFDPMWTPNTTDAQGRRYRFGNQPQVMQWNLLQLANALVPVTGRTEGLEAALEHYAATYHEGFLHSTVARLGWGSPADGDRAQVSALLGVLTRTETDWVLFHRLLADVPVHDGATDDELLAPLEPAFYAPGEVHGEVRAAFLDWLRAWAARSRGAGLHPDERRRRMLGLNPRFVPRNYLAQLAIDAAEQGDVQPLHELLDVLRRPYDDQPGRERFAGRRPEWARHKVGCSMLSCSS